MSEEPEITDSTVTVTDATPIETLIARIDAHDTEGEAIEAEMTAQGVDKKKIKEIRKADAAMAAAKKTRDALLGLAKAAG